MNVVRGSALHNLVQSLHIVDHIPPWKQSPQLAIHCLCAPCCLGQSDRTVVVSVSRLVLRKASYDEEGGRCTAVRRTCYTFIVQELCGGRGGRPRLSVLTSLLVSVDVKQYWTMLTHWCQLVPNNYVNRHPRTLSNAWRNMLQWLILSRDIVAAAARAT